MTSSTTRTPVPACPRCGATTVRKHVNKGPRAGLDMWSCTRWPDCTGAINIDPPTRTTDGSAAATSKADGSAYLQARFEDARRRDRLKRRAFLPFLVGFGVLAIAIGYVGALTFGPVVASFVGVLVGVVFLAALARLPWDSKAWAKGIEGERKASAFLAALEADGFVVLNNRRIPGRNGDIDHVVIGPTGVFAIETKNWSGKLDVVNDRLFAGKQDRTWAIEQLFREALAVQVALGDVLTRQRATVTPVLCAIGGGARGSSVGGVLISNGRDLAALLRRRPNVLGEAQVLELAALADERLRQPYEWEVG